MKFIGILTSIIVLVALTSGVTGSQGSVSPGSGGLLPVESLGTGFYEFRCNIEGSLVFLDNSLLGAINNGTLTVSVPVYDRSVKRDLRMESPGYTMYNETLLTGPKVGETMIVRGTLQVLPLNLTGTLSLAVSPPGGQVNVDEVVLGTVPKSGIIAFRTIKSGNRNVRISMTGYQDYQKQIYLEANMITNLRVTLTPLTTGTLQISSVPSGAQVNINGTSYGITPVTIPNMEQGTYTIEYSMQGYQPYQSQVLLTPNQTIPVSGMLQPIPTPTPTPSPPTSKPTSSPTPQPTEAALQTGIVITGLFVVLILVKKKED